MKPIPTNLLFTSSVEYNDAAKARFHRNAKKWLRELAGELGLEPTDYDLRSNNGGIAVSGEITLHADNFYVQVFSGGFSGPGVHVLYRTCKGRKDYTGGQNNITRLSTLAASERALTAFYFALARMHTHRVHVAAKPIRVTRDPEGFEAVFDEHDDHPCRAACEAKDSVLCITAPCTGLCRPEGRGIHYIKATNRATA